MIAMEEDTRKPKSCETSVIVTDRQPSEYRSGDELNTKFMTNYRYTKLQLRDLSIQVCTSCNVVVYIFLLIQSEKMKDENKGYSKRYLSLSGKFHDISTGLGMECEEFRV